MLNQRRRSPLLAVKKIAMRVRSNGIIGTFRHGGAVRTVLPDSIGGAFGLKEEQTNIIVKKKANRAYESGYGG